MLFTILLLLQWGLTQQQPLPPSDAGQNTATLYIIVGSDWCPECRRLEEKVLADTAFTTTLEQQAIDMVIVDFPQRKKQDKQTVQRNRIIAEKYDFEGIFPTLIVSTKQDYQQVFYHNESASDLSKIILDVRDQLRQ